MKVNKKELVLTILVGLMGMLFALLGSTGFTLEKDVGLCMIFVFLSLFCTAAILANVFFTDDWYTKIEEVPLTDFEEHLFKNKYILAHRETRMAFDIPVSVLDMLDLTTVRIRHKYDYKKRFKGVDLNLLDQKIIGQ